MFLILELIILHQFPFAFEIFFEPVEKGSANILRFIVYTHGYQPIKRFGPIHIKSECHSTAFANHGDRIVDTMRYKILMRHAVFSGLVFSSFKYCLCFNSIHSFGIHLLQKKFATFLQAIMLNSRTLIRLIFLPHHYHCRWYHS